MKKKLMALFLAMVMIMGLSATAFAAESDENGETTTPKVTSSVTADVENGGSFTINKEYSVTGTAPEETFTFTVSESEVKDGEADTAPAITIGSVTFDGTKTETKPVTVTLPTYQQVGEYQYTISETASNNAGVTTQDPLTLTVYVVNGENGLVCKVALKNSEGDKVDGFTGDLANKYESGSLAVSKTVTGNMGDKTKEFTVTVKFTNANGASTISYVEDGEAKTISFTEGTASAEIALKHGETITFTNIPTGTAYTVEENDYTNEGYDGPAYSYSDVEQNISANDQDTVSITNNKGVEVDTGITMDSLPYIMLLALVVMAGVAFFSKNRMTRED